MIWENFSEKGKKSMSDKAIILLMVLFVSVGVYAYEQYAVRNGQLSPIGQLVDFAGLSNEADILKGKKAEEVVVETEHKIFEFKSGESLQRLQKKYHAIEDQRLKLVENRQRILQDLMELLKDTGKDAEEYAKVINQEKSRFRQKFPAFDRWAKDMMDLQQESDAELREEKYQKLKKELEISLKEESSQSEMERILQKLQKFINGEKGEMVIEDCSSIEHCIEKQVGDIESNFNGEDFETGQDIHQLMALIQELKDDYQKQMDQSYIQEQAFEESNTKMEGKLQGMVKQLVKITQDDLKDLIYLYQEIEMERKMLVDYMEAEQAYWEFQHKQSTRLMKERIRFFKKNIKSFSKELKEKNQDLDYKRRNMVQQAQENSNNMKRMVEDRFTANRGFVSEVSDMIHIDVKRLVADQKYAIRKNASYLRDREAMKKTLKERQQDELNQQNVGGLGTEIKSNLSRSPELRKTDPVRTMNRFGLNE